jgi:hypothetical protein
MPLITVLLVLAVVGVGVALLNKFGGEYIAPGFLRLINIVAIVAAIIWLMRVFGLWAYMEGIKI